MRKIAVCFCFVLCFVLFVFPVRSYAHPASQIGVIDSSGTLIGSEEMGWFAEENYHLNGTTFLYRYALEYEKLEELMEQGMSMWAGTLSFIESSSAPYVYIVYDGGTTGEVGKFYDYSSDSSGHITTGYIGLNIYYLNSMPTTTPAHEIGHAVGLRHVSATNRLMHGNATARKNAGVTGPTAAEINGVKIITGYHTVHDWKYDGLYRICDYCDGVLTEMHNWRWLDYDGTVHVGECRLCGDVVYEAHRHYLSSTESCTRCGRTGPISNGMTVLPYEPTIITEN